ncbi:tetratricopeptide repeat protein [Sandaracinus amylolyticus]|uniref:tetratricopeptide repeat protein n=1 Tax=Sandaracinus amylolyticus TaxID=927083 RepID=UPI001F25C8F8|nr:tetratricopeptide repeat protein [Sandaracinus amylolyticus]UJR80837.1 Hypothetical protein I5071_28870 [Sandaracinus amylolyticus]
MLRATNTWVAAMACACAIACIAADAEAQDDQRARLHFESGASYYEAGEYEDALREFQRAYDLSHRPQLFYNLSLCYQNLGDLPQAADYLERYLAEVAEIENRANLEIRLRNLRERIARGQTGAPEPQPEPTPETTEPATTTTATTTPAETTATTTAPVEPAPQAEAPLNVPAIAGFSVAALGLVTAVIFGPLTIAEDSSLSNGCGATRSCTDDDLSTMRAFAAVTDVGLGVALAGAAVGVIFLIVGTGESAPSERTAGAIEVLPMASRDGAGIVIGGSF